MGQEYAAFQLLTEMNASGQMTTLLRSLRGWPLVQVFDVADDEAVLRHLGAVAHVVFQERQALRAAVKRVVARLDSAYQKA